VSIISLPLHNPMPHPYNPNNTMTPKLQPSTKQAQHDSSTQGKEVALHLIHLLPTSPARGLISDKGTNSRDNRLIVVLTLKLASTGCFGVFLSCRGSVKRFWCRTIIWSFLSARFPQVASTVEKLSYKSINWSVIHYRHHYFGEPTNIDTLLNPIHHTHVTGTF